MDYRSGRVPNKLVLSILMTGWIFGVYNEGIMGLIGYLRASMAVLAVFYPLYKIGTIGAGDIKLFSVTAGYLPGKAVIFFLMYSLLIAGIISVFKLLKGKNGRKRLYYSCSYIAEVLKTGKWQPYFKDAAEKRQAGICLSGPVFLSILLYLGGVY
jgi:Flp pilus assembly protein protease CpaA